MTRTSILGACCLAWLAGTTGLPQPADAQALTPITISYQPTNYWALPFYVANKKGWWKEVGLDPKFVLFPAGVPQSPLPPPDRGTSVQLDRCRR